MTVPLEPDRLGHLRKALRMEWEEEVRALDGAGHAFEAWLMKHGDGGGLRVGNTARTEPEPVPLELVVCLPKNATMDRVAEKAAACGATALIPVVSARSVVRPDPRDPEKYLRRWQAIADEALEQSEGLWRTRIVPLSDWAAWVAAEGASFAGGDDNGMRWVFASELRNEVDRNAAFGNSVLKILGSRSGSSVRLVIGPEGGFTPREREELAQCGYADLSLGHRVLRVETAVVAALSIVQAGRASAAARQSNSLAKPLQVS